MERGGVDDPLWPLLAHDARDANAVRNVDIGVRETDGLLTKGLHEILTELT
jgi:hypothetical protein